MMKRVMKICLCFILAASMFVIMACSKQTESKAAAQTESEEAAYAYNTVGDFFADDNINNALKSVLANNSTDQLRVSVRGQDNELIYKYTYLVDDFDVEEAAKNLTGREDEMYESMRGLIEQVTDNVREDAMVYIVFCTEDDTEFYRMSYDPAYQKAHAEAE